MNPRLREPLCSQTEAGNKLMPMSATILAIGPYSQEICDCLSYPATYYRRTKPGCIVVTELFGIIQGTNASTNFAAQLGISNPWDFNQHVINPEQIDLDGLRKLFQTLHEGEDFLRDLDRLAKLRACGFLLIFQPNG